MKKLLPPVLFLLFAIGIPAVCWSLDSNHNVLYPFNIVVGLPLLVVGLGIASWGKRLFQKVGTNVMTFDDPDILVTSGLYKITRNPMYLGFVIALFGIAMLSQGAIVSFAMVFLFLLITDRWYIRYEEQAMLRTFGKQYEEYCCNARRWI